MRRQRINTQLCITMILIVLVEILASTQVHAVPSVAIVVYDHGFAKSVSYPRGHFLPVNKTDNFTQDDRFVVAYFTAALATANVTWLWYDPYGQLYRNSTRHYECAVSPCTYVYYFYLASTAAARTGTWKLNLWAGGLTLYSDSFSISPVVTEDDSWNITILQSAPARVHGNLNVVIHPDNLTWSSYRIHLPYATNLTASEAGSTRTLSVMNFSDGSVVVNFGGARASGYAFSLSFDVLYGLSTLGGWYAGNFAFTWQWFYRYNDIHPNSEAFSILLPKGATLLDTVGINLMTLNQTLAYGDTPALLFRITLPPLQPFGWTLLYRDFTWRNLHPIKTPSTATPGGLALISQIPLPILPMTLGGLSLWSAIMSVFLLTGSELLSPIYEKTGVLVNRRRLRIAAMLLVAIFLTTTAYQIILSQSATIAR